MEILVKRKELLVRIFLRIFGTELIIANGLVTASAASRRPTVQIEKAIEFGYDGAVTLLNFERRRR